MHIVLANNLLILSFQALQTIFFISHTPSPPEKLRSVPYINDIFLLWTHGEDKLYDFIKYISSFHPTIKLTSSFSATEISFLDVRVLITNGKLETNLDVKLTDKYQYLLTSSCHPSHTQ